MINIIVGGLIFHLWATPDNIDRTSFQKNLMFKYNNINVLVGNNSIGKPIYGLGYDFNLTENLNFKVGGYIQDETEFNKLGVELATADFMPIIGLEYNLPITKRIYLTNLITPFIVFTGIGVKI